MTKLSIVAMLVALPLVATADDRVIEEKNETSTTLTGKKKIKHTKKVDNGTTVTETTKEVVIPKRDEPRREARDRNVRPIRHDEEDSTTEKSFKTEHDTTLTGKKRSKAVIKEEKANGYKSETTVETKSK